MSMVYEWREGSRLTADPQVVGELIEVIADQHDGIAPIDAIVDEARDESSPLHPVVFRLGAGDAAEAWYRQEARGVVNKLVVVVDGDNSVVRPAGFLSVVRIASGGPQAGYAQKSVVHADPELEVYAVETALRALNGWRRRYRHLTDDRLVTVFQAIDAV